MRETFEEDEEKKDHPSLPQQQATRKNVQEGDEQKYLPTLPQQQATRGGSLVTNTTQARLSVSGKISANA